MTPDEPLLRIEDLRVRFGRAETPAAVDGLTVAVAPGEALALVGESGCGKSTTALAVMGLLPPHASRSGRIVLAGQDLTAAEPHELEQVRGNAIGMIFQEPMTSLNPVYCIGDQIAEALRAHQPLSRRASRAQALELLDMVRLPEPRRQAEAYPHQLSGGQRQRAMIAMAIACRPKLLIADEPTTALDATIQVQILELIDALRRELGMALLLISHDLTLVSRWADRVVVMHHGQAMEELPAPRLFGEAAHPYTRGLIGASVRLGTQAHYRTKVLTEIRASADERGRYRFDLHAPARRPIPPPAGGEPILAARNLVTEYATASGPVRAVDDVSLDIACGETLGLVGESGSGKSTLSRTLIRLMRPQAGRILFRGQDLATLSESELLPLRRHIQMVFQDPYGSLNPRRRVEDVLTTTLAAHRVPRSERAPAIRGILDRVGLPSTALARYPHEFSGGQRQRIAIARALVTRPSLVICDEPVSALDVSVQAQILNLLVEMKAELGLSYLFISHDLSVVQYIADRVMVIQRGRIVEEGDHTSIWTRPQHPYTRQLIAAAA